MKGGDRITMTESELLLGLRLVGQGTAEQIGKAICRGRRVCRDKLKDLEARGVVHICGWQPTMGEVPPIYALGKGKRAPKPTRAESVKAWAEQNPDEFRRLQERRSKAVRRSTAIREQVRVMEFLATDQRPALERWACADLGKLPMVPFARPA